MITVLFFGGVLFSVLALMAWAADRPDPLPRPDHRIPADESRKLGPTIWTHVEHLFARKSRREQIVRDVGGDD